MESWLHAFLLTQLFEVPLYLWAGRKVRGVPRWLAAAGASALTHPVLWFCFPWDEAHYAMSLVLGEAFVVVAEAEVLAAAGFRWPFWTSLAVNAASCGAGLLLSALL